MTPQFSGGGGGSCAAPGPGIWPLLLLSVPIFPVTSQKLPLGESDCHHPHSIPTIPNQAGKWLAQELHSEEALDKAPETRHQNLSSSSTAAMDP